MCKKKYRRGFGAFGFANTYIYHDGRIEKEHTWRVKMKQGKDSRTEKNSKYNGFTETKLRIYNDKSSDLYSIDFIKLYLIISKLTITSRCQLTPPYWHVGIRYIRYSIKRLFFIQSEKKSKLLFKEQKCFSVIYDYLDDFLFFLVFGKFSRNNRQPKSFIFIINY